jgi:preprotein translocase subunit SecA
MLKFLSKIFGTKSDRDLKEIQPIVEQIKRAAEQIQGLSNDELRAKTAAFKARIQEARAAAEAEKADLKAQADAASLEDKEALFKQIDAVDDRVYQEVQVVLNEILPEAYAVVRETAARLASGNPIEVSATEYDRQLAATRDFVSLQGDKALWKNKWMAAGNEVEWNMVHYDVQLFGGVVIHQGKIAEMATGEGKTLVSTLPVYLNALTGWGVHLVTVNDYLARRDAEWMGPLFQFHGLTVDCIDKHQPHSEGRVAAYKADITYGTNNEFGFDYLRDNMARSLDDMVQRPHHFAIVDEVDSVLVDEARTPLIISGPTPKGDIHEFNQLKPFVVKLFNAQKAVVQDAFNQAKKLIAEGNTKDGGFQLLRAHRGLPKSRALIKFLSEEGMKAILQKTENFYLQDQQKEMWRVDEALYFTIEEKNNSVDLTERGLELLSKDTDPQFFILPDIGTQVAELEKSSLPQEEKAAQKDALMRDFQVKGERVHTMNQLVRAYTMFEKDVEYVVMDNKVKIVDEKTGRIMDGRRYSDGLHQAIEAKENVQIEAATQTYATITLQNYFRMYRKLAGMTGTAETEAGELWEIYKLDVVVIPTNRPISRKDMDDLVYKTKREKYNAVIDEIQKLVEGGRPVLVGTTSVETSELLSRMLKVRKINHNVLNAKLHQREAEIVAEAGRPGTVTIATNMAGRGTDIKLTPESKSAGGLAIIGTERHDSRRVDRQLRGRAGRQGDPGSSQFFVSLEDDLMRLFGSDRIAGLMDRMGLKDGEMIQHSMVTRSIERAQKKVEENHFGTRKRLLEYDDVMNSQRTVIYRRRKHALSGDRLSLDISNMVYDTADALVFSYFEVKDYNGFTLELFRVFGVESPVSEQEFLTAKSPEGIASRVFEVAMAHYAAKNERIAAMALPVIRQVYEDQKSGFQNISVPFTDGHKVLNIVTNLKDAYESQGRALIQDFEKYITLALVDDSWKSHLRDMDDLRQSVQGAVYEQKDPLLIYKFESFELFKRMLDQMNREMVSFLFRGTLPTQDPGQMRQAPVQQRQAPKYTESHPNPEGGQAVARPQQAPRPTAPVVRQEKKIGRNDQVTIQNLSTGEKQSLKYKQAEAMIGSGQWLLVEE